MAISNSGCVLASLEYVINGLKLLRNERNLSLDDVTRIRGCEMRLSVEKYGLEQTLSTIYGTVLPARRGDWESAAVDDNLRTRLGSFLGKFYAIQDRLNIILIRLARLAQLDRDDVCRNP
ncbi:hypothetical protein E5D57_013161 [Metarhizium anisopliae]|nr:hypothetical protein E5D57_013161 [Metarhizium anisopliae]